MTEKYYTAGEIFRLGLLKNHKGEPYKDKATVIRIISKLKFRSVKTPWGWGYSVSQEEVDKFNKTHLR